MSIDSKKICIYSDRVRAFFTLSSPKSPESSKSYGIRSEQRFDFSHYPCLSGTEYMKEGCWLLLKPEVFCFGPWNCFCIKKLFWINLVWELNMSRSDVYFSCMIIKTHFVIFSLDLQYLASAKIKAS